MTNRVFYHFGPISALWPSQQPEKSKFWKNDKNAWRYYHFTLIYHKWWSYDVWFLRYGVRQTEFFLILDHVFAFLPPNNLENENFEKMKKMPEDIINSDKCTINNNHMMYDSWDTKSDRQNFFHFWPFFALLPH